MVKITQQSTNGERNNKGDESQLVRPKTGLGWAGWHIKHHNAQLPVVQRAERAVPIMKYYCAPGSD
ncbi:hypothetical protein E2C01_067341 [Portunus trituberculatus]|uniref:Uncharacterized protein n=1 Tax=Portunus trituberculatus TaxID=210409 RepID=A0A5B7HTD4_PORTR|nr:hypothetical protein [Portunus trituberculatus]